MNDKEQFGRTRTSLMKHLREEYEKRIGLNSDRKRHWLSTLKSLKEKTFCDSTPIPIDLADDVITKKEIEWVIDDDGYEPESDL